MELNIKLKIEDGKVVDVKVEQIEEKPKKKFSMYSRFFDEGSPMWCKDQECNLMFLKLQQDYANHRLRATGHLFLNDVYDMLGFPRTKMGQVAGWVFDENNQCEIDFGLNNHISADFGKGYENTIFLDFNVQENILDKLEED